jgi:hypothetical protein
MHHVAVPYNLVRVGDVVDRPRVGGSDRFDVIGEREIPGGQAAALAGS